MSVLPLTKTPSNAVDSLPPSLQLLQTYKRVREQTERLTNDLTPEDCTTQSMPDASPTKWHLAHTTWFFETMVLQNKLSGYGCFNPEFPLLFNSYYNSLGTQHPRPRRGLLSRPSLAEVRAYREHVDDNMERLLSDGVSQAVVDIVELGLHHEQQHQELILTDIKHLFWCNPLRPVYRAAPDGEVVDVAPYNWVSFPERIAWIGHSRDGFAYDNEGPRHRRFIEAFELSSRLVTNQEYLDFMDDGGYENAQLWLSDGWTALQERNWRAPQYWVRGDGDWNLFTLSGPRPIRPDEPACHLSYYEADAFARWVGARLPTEAEWEIAAADQKVSGGFVESERFHPQPWTGTPGSVQQLFGDVWEWTKSGYEPYPGYRPPAGPLGEYNSKFMCSQLVLRGGSCVSPASHLRATYRNFFPPEARWQFSGLRLARDAQ